MFAFCCVGFCEFRFHDVHLLLKYLIVVKHLVYFYEFKVNVIDSCYEVFLLTNCTCFSILAIFSLHLLLSRFLISDFFFCVLKALHTSHI